MGPTRSSSCGYSKALYAGPHLPAVKTRRALHRYTIRASIVRHPPDGQDGETDRPWSLSDLTPAAGCTIWAVLGFANDFEPGSLRAFLRQ